MKLRKRTIWRWLGALALLLLVAGLAAPFLSANRFRPRLQQNLEHALGRRVEIGEVHLNLFNGPGFSLSRVIIHEDPRTSLEPFAYIGTLEGRVNFKSLWSGRLEFSSLRLDEPSINLVKPRAGAWNFEPLLRRTVGAATPQGPAFPAIRIRGGRINFKFGDLKSVFYFTDPDIDVAPPSRQDGEWRIRFSGQPARTDRAAYGFGRFAGRGRWRPEARTGGQLEFFLDLEKSPVAELITLLHGHDIGIHGQISSRARLAGPVSGLEITGRLQVGDIHRWDLMPPHGEGWPLDYRGRLDLVSQSLELETVSAGGAPLPFALRFRAADYLLQPRWGFLATLKQFPLAPLPEVARHMGLVLPEGFALAGELAGAAGYSPQAGIQGRLASEDVSVRIPDSSPLRLRHAQLVLDGERVQLLPATLLTSQEERATLEAGYSWKTQVLEGTIETSSMAIGELRPGSVKLLGTEVVPLLENCQEGAWKGRLRYHRAGEAAGEWTGTFELRDAQIPLPGMAAPLELTSARAVLREGGAVLSQIRARLGQAEFGGEYRYRPGAARPHQFRVVAQKLEAAEVERLLLPTLQRSEGFLARALRLGRPRVPPWLEERHADGTLEIGALVLGDLNLEQVRAHLRWDAANVEITDLEAGLGEGLVTGRMSVNLGRASPVYRMSAQVRFPNWRGGPWEGKGVIQTAGAGREFWRNLRAEGSFHGRALALDADTELRAISGSYQFSVARGAPRLSVTELQATMGQDVFQGQGATRDDGRLYFELSDGRKQLRLSGALWPFQLVWQRGEGPG